MPMAFGGNYTGGGFGRLFFVVGRAPLEGLASTQPRSLVRVYAPGCFPLPLEVTRASVRAASGRNSQ